MNCSNNKFFQQDLSVFSHLVNVKELWLGGNDFVGSLQPLQGLIRLKVLDISNTNIESGLEYLPDSIQHFFCLADQNSTNKVKKTEKEIERYGEFSTRKEANKELIELIRIMNNLEISLANGVIANSLTEKGLQIFIWQTPTRE